MASKLWQVVLCRHGFFFLFFFFFLWSAVILCTRRVLLSFLRKVLTFWGFEFFFPFNLLKILLSLSLVVLVQGIRINGFFLESFLSLLLFGLGISLRSQPFEVFRLILGFRLVVVRLSSF